MTIALSRNPFCQLAKTSVSSFERFGPNETDSENCIEDEPINYFLKQAGSDKTADDLFELKIAKSEYWKEEKIEEIMDEFDCDEETAKRNFKIALENGEYDDEPDTSSYEYDRHRLILIPKDGKEPIDVASKISEIFDIDGCWDG